MNTQTTQPKRAAIYVRVSTADQTEGYGLKAQLHETRKYAEARGYNVVAEFQDVISGAADVREGLNAAEAAGLRGDYDVLVVREISRFARKTRTALEISERLSDAGVEVTDTKGNSSENKLLFTILNAIAEHERLQIKERMVGGRREAAAEGKWIGGSYPLGYTTDENGFLEVDPDQADLVQTIFNMAVQTDEYPSLLSIATELNQRGVTPAARDWGDRDVTSMYGHSHIQRYLTDPIYKGAGREVSIGEETFTLPADPIVTEELWDQAAKVVENRRKKYDNGGDGSRIYALGGRIVHRHKDGAEFSMRGEMKTRKATEDFPYEFEKRFYRCSAVRNPNTECQGTQIEGEPRRTTVIADDVESRVLVWALSRIANPELFAESIKDHRRAELAAETDIEVREVLEAQLDAIPGKRDRAAELYAEGVWTREKFDSKVTEFDADQERISDELAALNSKLDPSDILTRLQTMPIGDVPFPGDFNPGDAEWPRVDNWLRAEVEAFHEGDHPLHEVVQRWVAYVVDTLDLRVIVHDRDTLELNGGIERQSLGSSPADTVYDVGIRQPKAKVEFSAKL